MGGEEADKERREEELQALEAIYGDDFTLGKLHSCHFLSSTSKPTSLSHMLFMCHHAQVFCFTMLR